MGPAGPGARPGLALLLLLAGAEVLAAASPPAPPLFNVSLDAAPELRWLPVLRHFDLDFLRATMAHILGNKVPKWVHALIGKVVEQLARFLPQPFTDEIRGMCEVLNYSLADCLLLNLAYESTAFCTSIVAQDSRGHIYHGRNLDYPFGNFLRKLTVDVQFLKNGQILTTAPEWAQINIFILIFPGERQRPYMEDVAPAHVGEMWQSQDQSPMAFFPPNSGLDCDLESLAAARGPFILTGLAETVESVDI